MDPTQQSNNPPINETPTQPSSNINTEQQPPQSDTLSSLPPSKFTKALLSFLIFIILGIGAYLFLPLYIKKGAELLAPTPTQSIQPTSPPTPTEITVLSTSKYKEYFANPDEPALDENGKFTPDAERITMLYALKLALVKYHVANKKYPESLESLFPEFAFEDENDMLLTQPPVDPVTKQPYKYVPSSDGQTFTLSTTMSAGKEFTVTQE